MQYCVYECSPTIISFLKDHSRLIRNRADLKDRQTRQLPRAPKPEGPQGSDSKMKFIGIELCTPSM